MSALTAERDAQLADLIRQQIEEVLGDRAKFTHEDADRLDTVEAQLRGVLGDRSFGRILDGPLWLSGTSVVDGTITAGKISVTTLEAVQAATGTLNVTGTLTAAASYPATSGERITMTSAELAGHNSADAKTFSLAVDGSGFIGIGSSQLSWSTAGVVTVPAAAISSLTIADVGSGTFNGNFDAGTGRVRAGTALQRVELTSAGLLAYNTGGTQTFKLDAATGSLDMLGTFTMRSSASGARIEVANVGVRGYNAAGTLTFSILSSDGSGQLGASTPVTWNSAGTVVVNGSLLVGSTVTSDKINVSTLSAISANMGTITAGTISAGTVNAGTITTGTLNGALLGTSTVASGAIASLAADKLTAGTISAQTITFSSTGKITNSDGDEWNATGIILRSSGSFGDSIKWTVSGVDKGSVFATTAGLWLTRDTGGGIVLASGGILLYSTWGSLNFAPYIDVNSSDVKMALSGTGAYLKLDSSGRTLASANIFPQGQTNDYLGHNGTDIGFGGLTTAAGAGSLVGYFQLSVNGTSYKVPYYNLA